MTKTFRLMLITLFLCGLISAIPLTASAATQSTLSGEYLSGDNNLQITNVHCHIKGRSTFDYHASGQAGGPYPGTFEEWGTVVIGPQTHNTLGEQVPYLDGAWESIRAGFTITSTETQTQIRGAKILTDKTYNNPYNLAWCASFPNPSASPQVTSGYVWGGESTGLQYVADIAGPTGRTRDSGKSHLIVVDANYMRSGYPQVFKTFSEDFTSSSG